jgi:hypothetical protein
MVYPPPHISAFADTGIDISTHKDTPTQGHEYVRVCMHDMQAKAPAYMNTLANTAHAK